MSIFALLCICLLLLLCGDVELNPGPKIESLSLGHINARSLNIEDKFEEISLYVLEKKIQLFGISETWLNDNSPVDQFCIPGYSLVRKDRQNMQGGGVALYVSDFLIVKRRCDLENGELELLWIEIKIRQFKLIIGVCYYRPVIP